MITKEELEKMIENGETVYGVLNNQVCDVYEEIFDNFELGSWYDDYGGRHHIKLEDLYRTKEEAEWAAKMHATREERFEPPTWEEFDFDDEWSFIDNKGNEWDLYSPDKITIRLVCFPVNHWEFEYTKENYTKACEIAKRLFLGDEI